jgi:hypothetical protein
MFVCRLHVHGGAVMEISANPEVLPHVTRARKEKKKKEGVHSAHHDM